MRIVRGLIFLLLILIVLSVLVAAGLMWFVNPNQFKPILIKEVKTRTHYQLVLDGDLDWSFYPRPGIKVHRLKLIAPNTDSRPFLDAEQVVIGLEWKPLLRGEKKLKGNISMAQFDLMKLKGSAAKVDVNWEDGVLILNPITAKLYQGSFKGEIRGSDFSNQSVWHGKINFNQIQLQPLLSDLYGVNAKLNVSGLADLALNLDTKGKDKQAALSHLNGTTQFSVKNGELAGIDINYFMQTADALINRQPIKSANRNSTAFESLTGSVSIKNGVANNKDLLLSSTAFTTQGEGEINLVNQTMDYQLTAKSVKTAGVEWVVPVLVTGDIKHPKIHLDMVTLNQFLLKSKLKNVKEKVKQEIQKNIPGKTGEFLQHLLGN